MHLYVIYGQRKERYAGEYAPEVLAAIDEVGNDDNPDYLIEEKEKALATKEFESVVVVTLKVNGAQIMERLRPAQTVLPAIIA